MCLLHIGRVSDMNSSLLITFLLGLAGVVVIWMGVAALSLGAVTVGRDYVFTAPGVSRLGPRRGRRIMETPFTYQGLQVPLQRVLTPDRPTLLVFLANLGRDEQVCETLIPSLLQFVRFSEEGIKVVVFCTSASERIAQLVAADSNITVVALTDERLTTALGVRVMPYAVLIDAHGKVLEKGLLNHLEHLCLLVVKGGHWRTDTGRLGRLNRTCESHLKAFTAQEAPTMPH